MDYLLLRIYNDGSIWTTTGSKERIYKLHSNCDGKFFKDYIYIITSDGIYKQVEN